MGTETEALGRVAGNVGEVPIAEATGRWRRLRAATEAAHTRLDRRIMAAEPFANRARYGRFLVVQHAFHSDVDALYASSQFGDLLPDLDGRRRLPLIARDLADLGLPVPAASGAPAFNTGTFNTGIDVPTALGWLYVVEGSNLGAAFLLKEAARLELSESFGARHLAPAPQGRGLAWRTFTGALDAIDLSADEEVRVDAGANAAFARVYDLVETLMPLPARQEGSAPETALG